MELHAGAHERSLGAKKRHGLALHVGAHERTVGVIVLEEGDHRGRDRPQLARRHIHVIDVRGGDVVDFTALAAHEHAVLAEATVIGEHGVGLRDDVEVLLVSREVVDLVGHPAVDDLAVGRLDEAECVDPTVGGERADQADVGAFRGLDRAHAAVVRGVHVADLEAGPLTRQTAGAQRRQAPLVGQARERVCLIHELRQLRGAEELLDGGNDGADVDEGLRRDGLDILGGHALANHALHARQARADLILDQLTDGAQAAIAEVVDVIGLDLDLATRSLCHGLPGVQARDVLDRGRDVFLAERALAERLIQAKLLVDLVATDLGQVVALRIEVEVVEKRAGVLQRGGLARAELAVEVE